MVQRPVTNQRLAALISEAGRPHATLARQVNHLARMEEGLDLRYDGASVYWWLRGRAPQHPTPRFIAETLSRWLGRVVHRAELGFSSPDLAEPDVAISGSAADGLQQATTLWGHTVRRREFLLSAGTPFVASAAVEAAVDWAFGPHVADRQSSGGRRVGMPDVERLHAVCASFADLDRAGSGHAFFWLADYLDREVAQLLSGTYSDTVGRELFAAVAALNNVAGWMAFDRDMPGVAQSYFTSATDIAKHAAHRAYGAFVLGNLATQCVFHGQGAQAVRLARIATATAGRAATPTLQARLATIEARGHALNGAKGRHDCMAAIRRADTAMTRADPAREASWLTAYSPAHHAGQVMHCLRDIGQTTTAISLTNSALDLPAANTRTFALHQILAASVYADRRDLDAACASARSVLAIAGGLDSQRLVGRLRQFGHRLRSHATTPAVRDYLDEAHETLPRR